MYNLLIMKGISLIIFLTFPSHSEKPGREPAHIINSGLEEKGNHYYLVFPVSWLSLQPFPPRQGVWLLSGLSLCSGRKACSRKENLITDEPDAWARSQAFCQLPKKSVLDRQISASDQTDEPTNHLRALKLLSCQKSLQGLWRLILLTNLTTSRFIYSSSSTHSPEEFS